MKEREKEKGRGGGSPASGDRSEGREERGRERQRGGKAGDGKSPLWKRDHSKYAEQVLLLAGAEDVSPQDPMSRPVQMPEY